MKAKLTGMVNLSYPVYVFLLLMDNGIIIFMVASIELSACMLANSMTFMSVNNIHTLQLGKMFFYDDTG